MNARHWLAENGYADVIALIEDVESQWRSQGIKTRRDWWETLAGDADGNPRVVAGRQFPVLWAARKRQGLKPSKNALKRNRSEKPPPIRRTARWPQRV
jgi:hypothetical protein